MMCRVLNYTPRERKFEVEVCLTKIKGYVIFANNYQDIPVLRDAYKNGNNISLYFDRYEGEKALFSYREIKSDFMEIKKQVEIKALFSKTDICFIVLFKSRMV